MRLDFRLPARSHVARRGVPRRAGVTLVELLIVVSIIILMLAVAVPRLRPMMESRRVREASRAVNAYFAAARNRAMETGRPVGVLIERLQRQPEAAVTLRMAEVPPPYAGDTTTARVQVRILAGTPSVLQIRFPSSGEVAQISGGFLPVYVGDPIRLNYRDPPFRLLGPDTDGDGKVNCEVIQAGQPLTAAIPSTVGRLPYPVVTDPAAPWNVPSSASLPLPFSIERRPETTAAAPLRLPGRTVIDLAASGTDTMLTATPPAGPAFQPIDKDGDNTNGIQDDSPVIIMFGPEGSVDRIYHQSIEQRVTEPIFLLIGRWDRMPATAGSGTPMAEDGLFNWQDIQNLWVVVNANSGLTTAAPVAAPSGGGVPADVAEAREYARHFQGIGGR
ncbi:hypothetical protein JCM19992_04410 [Thermostilla marina]